MAHFEDHVGAKALIACADSMLHPSLMTGLRSLIIAAVAGLASACSPTHPSTECKGLSQSKAVALAVKQKRSMLERSAPSYRDNFASDISDIAEDSTGWVAKVGFKGKDGRTLIALIDEDCYVGWTNTGPPG